MKTTKAKKAALKPVDVELAGAILNKVDNDGIWYTLREGYLNELHGTVLEPIMEAAKVAMRRFENSIEQLRETYEVTVL